MALFDKKKATGKWWIDHSLSIALVIILLVWMAVSMIAGYRQWAAEDVQIEFWVWYVYEWFMSTLADVFGVLLIVLLSKWFFERGSAESK